MLAILSDIHANLEALETVLADIQRRRIETVYCLGDVVGYGPNPSECVELAREFELCLAGNWEQFIGSPLRKNEADSDRLRQQYAWSLTQLSKDQTEFLATRKTCFKQNGITFAHGSPLDYVNDYLFPEHVYDREHMDRVFAAFDGLFMCGHTHLPGIHTLGEHIEPITIDYCFEPNGESAIINVGSVGQPRDGDPRACYVVYDGSSFEFVRLEYDWDTTRRKIDDLDWPPTKNGI